MLFFRTLETNSSKVNKGNAYCYEMVERSLVEIIGTLENYFVIDVVKVWHHMALIGLIKSSSRQPISLGLLDYKNAEDLAQTMQKFN